ncbi:hypothetical protein D3C81_1150140 [compost metagenome]
MRVGQQQATAVGRALRPDCHRVAASLRCKARLAGQCRGKIRCPVLTGQRGRLRPCQRLDELTDTPFSQQTTGQLDQVLASDRPHPVPLCALCRQTLATALGQGTVETTRIALQQITHWRRLSLEKRTHGSRRVEPGEKQVAGKVVPLLDGFTLGTEVARPLAVHRQHFVGQQAHVVLCVGITDAVPQAALILGHDVRHPKAGTANLCAGISAGRLCLRGNAEGDQGSGQAGTGHGTRNRKHGHTSDSGVIPIRRMAA